MLEATGDGGPPRFTATSPDGRVYRTPGPDDAQQYVKADNHLVFVNAGMNKTFVFVRNPAGTWTITPQSGSPAIVSLKAGRRQHPERVRARITGSGPVRTLRWRSLGRAHTRLVFSESMAGGLRVPILDTDKADGIYRFRVASGSHYGTRRLHVSVVHGYGVRQTRHVDTYTVRQPQRLPAPQRVRGRRCDNDVYVSWSGVKGALGYIVQVANAQRGRPVGITRRVSARSRSTVFGTTPGGGRLVARVHALNSDDKLGRAGSDTFPTGPSATTLAGAARSTIRLIDRARGLTVVTQCPQSGGHCQVVVESRRNGHWSAGRASSRRPTPSTCTAYGRAVRLSSGRSAGAAAPGFASWSG